MSVKTKAGPSPLVVTSQVI